MGVISDTGVGPHARRWLRDAQPQARAGPSTTSSPPKWSPPTGSCASEDEHPDLFWALRGGGANLGVATGLELQLHPVGPTVFGGLVAYHLEHAETVLRGVARLVKDLPEDLNAPQQTILGMAAPPLPTLPEEVHGTNVVGLVAF